MSQPVLVVFAATNEGGRETVRLALEAGQRVIAVVRASSDTAELKRLGAELRVADCLDREAVFRVFDGLAGEIRVVSSLGGAFRGDRREDSEGNINAIDAAQAAGAKRFVLVTTIGCGESYEAAWEGSKQLLAHIFSAKNQAESHLRACGLEWTIIRPGGLTIPQPTGNAILVESPMTMGMINKTDLGALTYHAAMRTAAANRAYTAVDRLRCNSVAGRVEAAAL